MSSASPQPSLPLSTIPTFSSMRHSDDALSESEQSDVENALPVVKRRGPDRDYVPWVEFDTHAEFTQFWEEHKKDWILHQSYDGASASIRRMKCRFSKTKGYRCDALLRIVFPDDDDSVQLYRTHDPDEHTHEPTDLEAASAMTDDVKAFIDEKSGINIAPERIHVLLTRLNLAKLPTLTQIQNYYYRNKKSPSGPFTDEQLKAYCRENSERPADPRAPFVAAWDYQSNTDFFVLWTSSALLEKQLSVPYLQVDSTHSLNYFSYPVGVIGFSDVNRKFHATMLALGPKENTAVYTGILRFLHAKGFRPDVVLGDGAASISNAVADVFPQAIRAMCYPHLHRRATEHLRPYDAELRELVLNDVELLRYARSKEEFDRVSHGMVESWPDDLAAFKQYFVSTWLQGRETGWYDGASPYPCNNNGLERCNRSIKEAHTLRRRLPFAEFLTAATNLVLYWSKTSSAPPDFPTVDPDTFRKAYLLSHKITDGSRRAIRSNERDMVVVESANAGFGSDADLSMAYVEHQQARTWNEYKTYRFAFHAVTPPIAAGNRGYRCTCQEGHRKRACKHAVFVMCKPAVGLLTYPPDAKALPLQQLGRKRGRPRNSAPKTAKKTKSCKEPVPCTSEASISSQKTTNSEANAHGRRGGRPPLAKKQNRFAVI